MVHIATCILLDRDGNLLAYLRDDKKNIPFPNHWDLFGGYVEKGETYEEALVREIEEELGWKLGEYQHLKDYEVNKGDVHPNIKHVYVAKIDATTNDLTLYEGQELRSIPLNEIENYKWANILETIILDYIKSTSAPKS